MENICEFREVRYKETVCSPRVSTSPGCNTMDFSTLAYLPQMGADPLHPQLVGIPQHDEAGGTPVVSGFGPFLQEPRRQPTPHYTIAMNASATTCCEKHCGSLVPLVINGNYNSPGKTLVYFQLSGSPSCGIPVSQVLRGELEGLIGRDDTIILNPESQSIRLRIAVSNSSPVRPSHRLICVESCRATKNFSPRSG